MDPGQLELTLTENQDRLNVFGLGIVVFDSQGSVVWPPESEIGSQSYPVQAQLDEVRLTLSPAFSDVFKRESSSDNVFMILVPVLGNENQFIGALAGVSNIRTSLLGATFAQVLELKAGESGFAYLVDRQGRVIYHRDINQLGRVLTSVTAVARAIGGGTGAVIDKDPAGEEVVSGFAPVPGTGWAIITQERWSKVLGPIQRNSVWILCLITAGGILSAALILIAIGRTLRPIKQLTQGAQRIAEGDFDYTITTSSADEIETLAQQFNLMAGTLKESYTGLEQRVAERTVELGESEERYRTLFEESGEAIFITDDSKIVAVNQAALDMFEFTREDAIGSYTADRYLDPADQFRFREEIVLAGGVRDFEVKLLKKDGTQMDCLLTASLRPSPDGTASGEIQGIVRDITQSKLAEEAELQQTREVAVLAERNRMAREIHDTMAQGFTGIVLQLEAAEQAMEDNSGGAVDHLGRARSLAREGLQDARRSVWGLLPHALEQAQLDSALQEEVRRFDSEGSERTEINISGKIRELPDDVQTVILRICQESLTNIRRHAGATDVSVSLDYNTREMRLEVKDNGVGFDPTKVNNQKGGRTFGLTGMEQRAQQLEGVLAIKSGKGNGTLVEVTIPTP